MEGLQFPNTPSAKEVTNTKVEAGPRLVERISNFFNKAYTRIAALASVPKDTEVSSQVVIDELKQLHSTARLSMQAVVRIMLALGISFTLIQEAMGYHGGTPVDSTGTHKHGEYSGAFSPESLSAEREWLEDWYKNRVITKSAARDSVYQNFAKREHLANLESLKLFVLNPEQDSAAYNEFELGHDHGDHSHLWGRYRKKEHAVYMDGESDKNPNAGPWIIHEMDHGAKKTGFSSSDEDILQKVRERYARNDVNDPDNKYMYKDRETTSRVMAVRRSQGFKPNEEVSKERLMELYKLHKVGMIQDGNLRQLFDAFKVEGVYKLLNYLSDNDGGQQNMDQLDGSNVPPTEYYA